MSDWPSENPNLAHELMVASQNLGINFICTGRTDDLVYYISAISQKIAEIERKMDRYNAIRINPIKDE
jgi:hypothetical protein